MTRRPLIAGLVLVCALDAAAVTPDAQRIGDITGLPVDVADGIAKVTKPRGDIEAVVDGRALKPFQGTTSWAAFQQSGEATMVMGDVVLLEHEVNPALSAALDNGLEVTALHNHFFFDRPRVYFMHIGGSGSTEQLARGVRSVFDAAAAAPKGEAFPGPTPPPADSIDPAPLEHVFGAHAQTKDGMAKFVFGRTTTMHGASVGAAMGVNTWAAFAGSNAAAVVDGDFAMVETELQGVLRALRSGGVYVVAIHSHMTHEEPRTVFLHYWGKGAAEELAHVIQTARETQSAAH